MSVAKLAARGLIGGLFFGHGMQKLQGWFGGPGLEGTGGMMQSLNMHPPRRNAILAGAVEAAGGAALTLGLGTPLVSSALIGQMIVAIRKVHLPNGPWAANGGWEYNAVLIAALAVLAEQGPGPISLDAAMGMEKKGVGWGLGAVALGAAASVAAVELGRRSAPPAATTSPAPALPPPPLRPPRPRTAPAPRTPTPRGTRSPTTDLRAVSDVAPMATKADDARAVSVDDAEPDGLGDRAELLEHRAGEVRPGVGDDVTDVAPGREDLTVDVDVVLGEDLVEVRQHSGRVLVYMRDPLVVSLSAGVETGQVHRQRGDSAEDIVAQLGTDEATDVLLGLFGRAAHVRGEYDVRQASQRRLEAVPTALGLGREHVHRRPGHVAGHDAVPQGVVVNDEAPREVEEQRPRPHPGELRGSEDAGISRAAVDVQGDGLDDVEQLVERGAAPGVSQGQFVVGVVEVDLHTQHLGNHRQLRSDVAVPDDPQRPATDLVATGGGLVPDAGVQSLVPLGEPTGHRDDVGDRELHHGAGVGVGRVERRDPTRGCAREVDLISADAERPDGYELGSGLHDPRGDVGLRADPEQVHAVERTDQLVLVERRGQGADLDTGIAEDLGRERVHVLQQQGSHGTTVSGNAQRHPGAVVPRTARAVARDRWLHLARLAALLDHLALRAEHVPDSADSLPGDVTGLLVLDPVVQRPPTERRLGAAVAALDRADLARVDALTSSDLTCDRRPGRETVAFADALAGRVLGEHVQRHAAGVRDELPDLRRGAGRQLAGAVDGLALGVEQVPDAAHALSGDVSGLLVLDPVVQRPSAVRRLGAAVASLERADLACVDPGAGAHLAGDSRPRRETVALADALV